MSKSNGLKILPIVFVITFLALLLGGIFVNAPVQSEDAHLASGLSHWRYGTYALYRVNPPLVREVATLPLYLFCEDHSSWKQYADYPIMRKEYAVGVDYLKENKNVVFRNMIVTRIVCFIFILAGLIACLFSARFFGGKTAPVVAVTLLASSPYFLGHTATIMPDAHAASMAILAVYFYIKWVKNLNNYDAFLAGLTLGLAELTKFTLLIFYPLFIVMWLFYRIPTNRAKTKSEEVSKQTSQLPIRRQFLQMVLMFTVSILVINMGYFFEGTGKQLRSFKFQTTLFTGCETLKEVPSGEGNRFDGSGNILETSLGYLPMPLPMNFIQGIDTQRLDFERGLPSYLRGEWSDHGWWYYYLYALLIKTPLGTLSLFLLAIYCSLFLKGYNSNWRDEMVILLPGVVLLAFVSSQTGFSVHSRYIIPALPFFFVWMSKVGRAFSPEMKAAAPKSSRGVRWLTVIFLAWSVGSSLWVYPHSIAYFNELAAILPTPEDKNYPQAKEQPTTTWQKACRLLDAGPLNGPRHLLDSNIDWGQDLFGLERWCKNHPEVDEIKTATSGSYPIELTTIPSTGSPPAHAPEPGWYALSVNDLYDKEKQYRYFLNFEPVTVIGYTIYVYHITQEDVDRLRL